MSDLNEIVPVENQDSRRDMLSQQFDEVAEAAPEPAKAEPAKYEKQRDESGKYAKLAPQAKAEPAVEPVEEPLWKRPPASWKKTITRTGKPLLLECKSMPGSAKMR